MEKQQTAVEWLHEKFAKATQTELKDNVNLFFKKAKKIEKQQIMNAFEDGQSELSLKDKQEYYYETFKK
jgi:RecG-like helicase